MTKFFVYSSICVIHVFLIFMVNIDDILLFAYEVVLTNVYPLDV